MRAFPHSKVCKIEKITILLIHVALGVRMYYDIP